MAGSTAHFGLAQATNETDRGGFPRTIFQDTVNGGCVSGSTCITFHPVHGPDGGTITFPAVPGDSLPIVGYLYFQYLTTTDCSVDRSGDFVNATVNGVNINTLPFIEIDCLNAQACWNAVSTHFYRVDVSTLFEECDLNVATFELRNFGMNNTVDNDWVEGATLMVAYCSPSSPSTDIILIEHPQVYGFGIDGTPTITYSWAGFNADGVSATLVLGIGDGQNFTGADPGDETVEFSTSSTPLTLLGNTGTDGLFDGDLCPGPNGGNYDNSVIDVSGLVNLGDNTATFSITGQADCLDSNAAFLCVSSRDPAAECTPDACIASMRGACCDVAELVCTDDVAQPDCAAPKVFTADTLCADLDPPCREETGCAHSRTYTLDADFDEGTLVNVNHDTPNQLQLNSDAIPLPFIWIAASNRGTIVRIDTKTGAVLGEYRTAPDTASFPNPSRTTVDLVGNAWVSNRNDDLLCGNDLKGSSTRVGLILGGTRVNGDGSPNPVGDYLAPPFTYTTCDDRDGDGLIKTSRGLLDIRPWPNAAGTDSCGGVSTAEDECIRNYTRVTGTGTRTTAIDNNNDVWIGGIYGTGPYHNHEKIDGITGLPIPGTQFNLGCGGYGGFVDSNSVLWSASQCNLAGLLRYDTMTQTGVCLLNRGDYGLGLDPNTGHVWQTTLCQAPFDLYELDATGTVLNQYPQPFSAQGVTVDGQSHVWMAELFGSQVWHLAPDPINPGQHVSVGIVSGFVGCTGVAVDSNGKIWAAETGDRASRIDPTLGPIGGGGFPVGAIDLSVDLGPGSGPYNYSDMTGIVGLAAADSGSWTVVHDAGKFGPDWGVVSWNSEGCAMPHEPDGTSLTVEVRAADSEAGLGAQSYVAVTYGVMFSGVSGRFIQIRVTFDGVSNPFATPVLCDLTVEPICLEPSIDIRPGQCPNLYGPLFRYPPLPQLTLPISLVGSADFDATQVNAATLRLIRVDGVGSFVVPTGAPVVVDNATAFLGALCGCHLLGADGTVDLRMFFGTTSMGVDLNLFALLNGEEEELRITGRLNDGTLFRSKPDCVKRKYPLMLPPPLRATPTEVPQ